MVDEGETAASGEPRYASITTEVARPTCTDEHPMPIPNGASPHQGASDDSGGPRYASIITDEPPDCARDHHGASDDSDSSTDGHGSSDRSCSSSYISDEEIMKDEHHEDCETGGGPLLPRNVVEGDLKEADSWENQQTARTTASAFTLCVVASLVSASAIVFLTAVLVRLTGGGEFGIFGFFGGDRTRGSDFVAPAPQPFPPELLNSTTGAYSDGDFVNSDGRTPPFWKSVVEQLVDNGDSNLTLSPHWGPCLPPLTSSSSPSSPDWPTLVEQNRKRRSDDDIVYPVYKRPKNKDQADLAHAPWGLCRPGFLIIGAGKCGTSSLYHYLVGHDRVLPAKEKQIHYFKYHPRESMSWYLSHFPSTETFLASGALMTGEASPGYLPYPSVAFMAASRLPGPKIITIARDPLDRAWSSYKYNYATPALEKAMKGRLQEKSIPKGKSRKYYRENHLFTFEEMLRAELAVLKECLQPGGTGETRARKDFGRKKWAVNEFLKREQEGIPPLIEVERCYGGRVSKDVPRRQWKDLIKANPDKIVHLPNLHLVESFIGRGLYTLPLEWWYLLYPAEDMYLVCNEDMRENAARTVGDLSKWLGLPDFDFTPVVEEGMYNVGGHRGYDLAVPWNETDADFDEEGTDSGEGEISSDGNDDEQEQLHLQQREAGIPISDELRKEILDFVQPYNERLFELMGRRCKWL